MQKKKFEFNIAIKILGKVKIIEQIERMDSAVE
jgi:hypothetical protein